MGSKTTLKCKLRIKELFPDHSVSEISKITGVSDRTIFRIAREWNLYRTPDQEKKIRSERRKSLIKEERRRVIFGQEQKTELKVFSNKRKHALKYKLKRIGYLSGKQNRNLLFYTDSVTRNLDYETQGKKLGLTFEKIG